MKLEDVPDIDKLIQSTNPLQTVPSASDHSWAYTYLSSKERTGAVTGTIIHSDGGLGVRGLTKVAGLLDD
jgi:2,3-dihydroxy-2,3-dihydrophenylpropionate dehydrogenase